MSWVAANGSTDPLSNQNGEFDIAAPGNPNLAANWGGDGQRVCGASAFNGGCSLRIEGIGAEGSDFIPVTAGQRYDINLRLKVTGTPGTVLVRVFFWSSLNPLTPAVRPDSPPLTDPNKVWWTNAQQITATQDWTAMENTVTIPQGAAYAHISVATSNGPGMTTWVDSVAFARSTALPKRVDYSRVAVDANGAFFTSPAEYDLASAGDEFLPGVWRTTDGGSNWYKLNRFLFPGPVTYGGPAVFPNFSAPRANATAHSGALNGYSLSVGPPGANQVIYWGTNFWLFKSINAGATWTQSDSTTDASGNSYGNKNDVASHAVVLDSRRQNRLYYGDADSFLQVTQNLDPNLPLPAKFHEQLPQGLLGANPVSGGDSATSVALDPANADHVFVGWGWWDLPIGDPTPAFANDPKNTTGVAEATYNGTSWSWSNQQKIGTTGVGMVRLALDATASPRMLYAAKYANGVYQRPADQAVAWSDLTLNSWTPRPAVWKVNSIAKSPGSRRLFAGFGDPSATCLSNGPPGQSCAPSSGIPSGDTGVWAMDPTVSTAWTKITSSPVASLSCPGSDVSSLAYDPVLTLLPVGASTLYVGTHSALQSGRGGLYKGTCTGACAAPTDWSWCRVLPTGQPANTETRVNGVAQSSESPNVLYAVVSQNETLGDTATKAGLWGSRDAGLNWRYIADVPAGRTQNLWNVALAASPVTSTSRTLYAATFGTGLFQGKVSCTTPVPGSPDFMLHDEDGDGVNNYCDNCRYVSNGTQADANADGIGDACPPPVASYSFDAVTGSTLPDVSGNPINNGTIHGATLAPGRFGNAMSFNGTSQQYVQVANNSTLQMTNAMTLEAWVKPSQSMQGTMWRTVIQMPHDLYFLSANSDANQPAVGGTLTDNNGCCLNAKGGGALPSGQWHFLAATYNGSTNTKFRLYLDGVQVATASRNGSLNLQTSTSPLWLGGNEYPNEFFPGLIDNVRIYKRVLSQGEIQADMNTPLGP